jgi:threonine dehydrogenase-like Zn-dependent dehydrogenase
MAGNKAVAYMGEGKVEVQSIDYPELELKDGPGVHPDNVGRKTPHGVILKVVSTNICGSDQHMVRGRTTAPSSSRRATSARSPSTSPAGAAAAARRATPASA